MNLQSHHIRQKKTEEIEGRGERQTTYIKRQREVATTVKSIKIRVWHLSWKEAIHDCTKSEPIGKWATEIGDSKLGERWQKNGDGMRKYVFTIITPNSNITIYILILCLTHPNRRAQCLHPLHSLLSSIASVTQRALICKSVTCQFRKRSVAKQKERVYIKLRNIRGKGMGKALPKHKRSHTAVRWRSWCGQRICAMQRRNCWFYWKYPAIQQRIMRVNSKSIYRSLLFMGRRETRKSGRCVHKFSKWEASVYIYSKHLIPLLWVSTVVRIDEASARPRKVIDSNQY